MTNSKKHIAFSERKQMKNSWLFAAICCIPFVGILIGGTYLEIDYSRHVSGHLKRAADANTVEIAVKELDIALSEMKQRNLTSGSTHVLWSTPGKDVGFWYENIEASRNELSKVTADTTQLERTNMLMKLRETLLDDQSVTQPDAICLHPHNKEFFWWGLSCLGLAGFGVWVWIKDNNYFI